MLVNLALKIGLELLLTSQEGMENSVVNDGTITWIRISIKLVGQKMKIGSYSCCIIYTEIDGLKSRNVLDYRAELIIV